ncbi:hypothetical protein J3R82DRAFT_383 [Butyriboletus roseoflavus]|nr:hypothetical protein J3R82DRAFT_383 [Butyriboletus roseoflavus]
MDMLARLSHRKARWLNLRVEHGLSMCDGRDALQIDLNFVDLSWCHMMTLCGKSILPVYRSLKGMLEQDIDHVSKLLSELDPLVEESEHHSRTEWGEPRGSPSIEPVIAPHGLHSSDPEQRRRKRRRSSTLQEPIVIRPTDTFAPTIIIHPLSTTVPGDLLLGAIPRRFLRDAPDSANLHRTQHCTSTDGCSNGCCRN